MDVANSLFIIDSQVSEQATLIAGLPEGSQWVVLNPDQDGLVQIQSILASRSQLDSIQILSHGSSGALFLGNTVLNNGNIQSYSGILAEIGKSLTPDGDILLYGCDVASGEEGQSFIQNLSKFTQAEVAASSNSTGNPALGGDWVLERQTGNIHSSVIQPAEYAGILAANTAPSFYAAGDGKLTTAIGSSSDYGYSVTLQPDGKILVAGYSNNGSNQDFALVRYNPDGSLDTTFSGDGKLTTDFDSENDQGYSVTVQTDGKILVAGLSNTGSNDDFALVRYNPDGTLDTTFSGDGKLTTAIGSGHDQGYSVTVQPDGKILVAGESSDDFALVRYNPDGSLDTTFSGDGKLTTDFGSNYGYGRSVTVQPDGKILVAGFSYTGSNFEFALARYNPDGSLDTTFSVDGILTTVIGPSYDYGRSVTVQPDGRILVAGSSYNGSNQDFALVRYNPDGTLDTTFSGDGMLTTDFGFSHDYGCSVMLQPDGKILVAGGNNGNFALARYNPDGSLDTAFSGDGKLATTIGFGNDGGYSATLQPDGKILVAGVSDNGSNFDFALARYNPDGSLDTSFDPQPVASYSTNTSYTENAAPIVLNSSVLIQDADLAALGNYAGASITLVRQGGTDAQDLFSSVGNLSALTEGSNLVHSGTTTIGTVTQNSGGTLVLTFNSNATQALVNEALRSIAYQNSSDTPPASVQINWIFNDGNTGAQGTGGALSVTGTTTVAITAVNDAPIGDVTISGTSTQGETLTAANTLTDVDGLGIIGYQWQADGINIAGAIGTTYVLTQAEVGKTITVVASYFDLQGTMESVTSVATAAVANVNDAPAFVASDGKLTTDFGSSYDYGYSVMLQPDGKILVAGYSDNGSYSDFALARYNSDGILDTTFSGDGKLTTAIGSSHDYGYSVTLQPDGKILVAGFSWISGTDFSLVRYNPDGTLDPTFSGDGKLTTAIGSSYDYGLSVTVQSDGKILVAGYSSYYGDDSDFALARYNPDGSLDTSFSGDGKLNTDFGFAYNNYGRSVTVQPDGKILVAGESSGDFALARYNPDGTLDTTFSSDGKLTTDFGSGSDQGYSLTVQPDGKILVAGESSGDFALARYNPDGTLDTTFSGDGVLTTGFGSSYDIGHSVTLQPDGKILVAGESYNSGNYDFALVRYNPDGTLDTTFSGDGMLTTDFGSIYDNGYSVTMQADGKILVAGGSNGDFALVRYNPDGSLDTDFDLQPVASYSTNTSYTENSAPIVLDSSVLIQDADLTALGNYDGASITLSRNGGGNAQDVFSATGNLSAFTEGSALVVSGTTTIGTVTQNSAGTLVLTFNSNATQSLVNETLRSIAYQNSSDAPPASVQINWIFSDGNAGAQGTGGALSVTGSTTVAITAVNDAPEVTSATLTVGEGGTVAVTAANFGITDPDSSSFTYTVSGVTNGQFELTSAPGTAVTSFTSADLAGGLVQFVHDGGISAPGFSVTVNDGATNSNTLAASITFNNINDAPTGSVTISGTPTQGETLTASNTLADADGLGTLGYQWQADGIDIGGATDATYVLTQNEVGKAITVVASYTDLQGTAESVTSTETAAVANVNDAPTFVVGDGKLTTIIGSSDDYGYSVTLQPDGKILVAGVSWNGSNNDFALVRYNPDGSLDTTFSGDGKLTTAISSFDDVGYSVTMQADGKILVAGDSNGDFALVRYNPDGTLDTTFPGDGKLSTDFGSYDIGYSVTVQTDGKILVAGGSGEDFALARYNPDGTLDTTFSGDGKLTTDFGSSYSYDIGYSVTMQPDGKILVAGESSGDFALARYNPNGTLDTSFSEDGKLTTDFGFAYNYGRSVTVQPDGKILVAGYGGNGSNEDFALVRYNPDGTLDTTFSGDGMLTTAIVLSYDEGYSVTVQPDGKILVAGASDNVGNLDFVLVRYNFDGTLDTTFSGDGMLTTDFGSRYDYGNGYDIGYSVTLQPDGKILVAGHSSYGDDYDFALARYNPDGSLDTSFDPQPVASYSTNTSYTENSAPIVLDSSVLIQDADLAALGNYAGASITLVRQGGTDAQDLFSSVGNLSALTEGSNLVHSGTTTIGTVTQNSGGTLVLTFNSNATQALVNETLRSIAYQNSSDTPPASVQINWTFNDGNTGAQGTGGALTASGSTTVTITAANDAPVVTSATLTVAEGGTVAVTAANFGITDPDSSSFTYTVSGVTNGQFELTSAPGTAITSFTSADLAGNLVQFVHDGGESAPGFSVTVNDGMSDSNTLAASITFNNINDAPTGGVTISGTATQGETLTAANTLADADGLGTLGYQWQADGIDIAGATDASYVLTQNEVGKAITVVASYTDLLGTAESVTSTATTAVTNINDAPTGSVTISGTPTQGETLTASNTLADADGLGTLGYQWQADGIDIAGATDATYVLTQNEVGKAITVVASYTDLLGTAESMTSSATSAVANVNDAPTGSVTISGTPTQGETLTASNTLADADGLGTLGYQWQADGIDIAGATDASYVLTQNEVGKAITVVASYTDLQGTAESVSSTATLAVANVNDAPNGGVTISGTATQGETLTASNDLADADGLGTIGYQWQADGIDIAGATGTTYVLTQNEVGKEITVVASYTDLLGTAESVASLPTMTVVSQITQMTTTTYTGTSAHEWIVGTSGNDTIYGEGGNDILDGGPGVDALNGGTGNDLYIVDLKSNGVMEDTVLETSNLITEIDTIQLRALFPDNTTTNAKDVSLTLGANIENMDASNTGTSRLSFTGNNLDNVLTGNAGDNTLTGLAGSDTLFGGAGNDVLIGGADADIQDGGEGSDLYMISSSGEYAGDVISDSGTSGVDELRFAATTATTLTLFSTLQGVENIVIGTGTDSAAKTNGKAAIDLDASAVTYGLSIQGNSGINTLTGSGWNDTLDGGSGNDMLIGGNGNDSLIGGAGSDSMQGGEGDDTYTVDNATDGVSEVGGSGMDTVLSSVTYTLNTLDAEGVENLILTGTGKINGTGNALDNLLSGNSAANILSGLDGADLLIGGLGNDTLTGGLGSDIFRFDSAVNGTNNRDSITDFSVLDDLIQLDNDIMTGLGDAGMLAEEAFHSGTVNVATEADDRIIYNSNTGALYYDADGNGSGNAIQFATLIGLPALTHADFVVI